MNVIRSITLGFTALTLALGASAAYADRDDDRHGRWGRSGHERHYDKHDRKHHHKHYKKHKHHDRHYHRHHYHPVHERVIIRNYHPPVQRTVVVQEPPYYGGSRVTCYDGGSALPTLLGGAAGGIIGSRIGNGSGRTAAIITGTLVGAGIGQAYTSYDRYCTHEAFETAAVGVPVYWENDDYGYQLTPTRDYRTAGRYCREYQATATVGSRRQETYGTACRQPDGSWEIVN